MKRWTATIIAVIVALSCTTVYAEKGEGKGPSEKAFEKADENAAFKRSELPGKGKGAEKAESKMEKAEEDADMAKEKVKEEAKEQAEMVKEEAGKAKEDMKEKVEKVKAKSEKEKPKKKKMMDPEARKKAKRDKWMELWGGKDSK